MKVLSWIIALCGLWEFGDIAAFFVPGFGAVPPYVSNHIVVGLILVIVRAWAALARNVGAARRLHWIAAVAGLWLVIASFVLGSPIVSPGLWNDIAVGLLVTVLALRAALSPRAEPANRSTACRSWLAA